MQFLSALVEHLVVGVVSLLWLMPLMRSLSLIPDIKPSDHKELIIAVGIPAAYVVGIYVDVVASVFTSSIRRAIDWRWKVGRKKFFGAHVPAAGGGSYERTAIIIKRSPDEAARYLLMLSGREKIARGVFTCLVIATFVNAILPRSAYTVSPWLLSAVAALGLLVWLRLNALTDNLKVQLQ